MIIMTIMTVNDFETILLQVKLVIISIIGMDTMVIGIEEVIETDPKVFFWYVDLKKKLVRYRQAM
jgi:hypothetical protein